MYPSGWQIYLAEAESERRTAVDWTLVEVLRQYRDALREWRNDLIRLKNSRNLTQKYIEQKERRRL
jgi:hypothetical protein